MSQTAVAQRLHWSFSKVQRIESGEVTVSPTDLNALLEAFGIGDEEEIDRLTKDARIARRERYWTAQDHREHLSPGLRQLIQFEAAATSMRIYAPFVIPGVLQIPRLADAVLSRWRKHLTEDERRVRTKVRETRRRDVVDRPDAPEFLLLFDITVLSRVIGGLDIMAEQFESLVELVSPGRIALRLLPLDEGAFIGTIGAFTLLELSSHDPTDAVVYREQYTRDVLIEEVAVVKDYRRLFDEFWVLAMDEGTSLEVIRARAAALRAESAQATWRAAMRNGGNLEGH